MIQSMFHLPLPVLEKILRPVIVYLFLIGFLRLFGKRELAQLNPFLAVIPVLLREIAVVARLALELDDRASFLPLRHDGTPVGCVREPGKPADRSV